MRIHLSALILLLIVVAVVDFYLYFRYNRFILKRFHFTRKILWSFHWTVTLSVIFGFWWFSTHIRLAETTAMYSAFTWFLYSFLLIYVTKIVGTLVSISGLMLRFIQKFAPPVPKAAPIKTNRISRAQFLGTIGIDITAIPFVSMLVITSYSIHYTKLYDLPQPWVRRSTASTAGRNNFIFVAIYFFPLPFPLSLSFPLPLLLPPP